jgi:hypothetical protein
MNHQPPFLSRALVALLVFWSVVARAAHPLVTEDTGTQGPGKFQLELQHERADDDEDGTRTRTASSAAVLSYGLHADVDVILTLPHERTSSESAGDTLIEHGRGDVAADVKWRFVEHEQWSLALKSGVRLPTGDEERGLGAGKRNVSALLIGSAALDPLALHVTAGYVGNRNVADEKTHAWLVSVGAWASIGDVKWAADLGRESSVERDLDTPSVFGILGLIYSPHADIDLDLGVKWGFTDPAPDRAVLAGVTLRF